MMIWTLTHNGVEVEGDNDEDLIIEQLKIKVEELECRLKKIKNGEVG